MSIKPTGAPQTGQIPNHLRKWSNKNQEKYIDFLDEKVKDTVQACSDPEECLIVNNPFNNNGFLGAIHSAFSDHIPLKIDPDDIWLIFLAQVSLLVGNNPEKYRNSFVNHSGKQTIEIRNDSLVKDEEIKASSKKWKFVFPDFEQRLNESMKLNMNIAFSTTTLETYIASEILIMAAMKDYFNYRVFTMCGIPEIRINGTVDDWQLLKTKLSEICNLIFEPHWIPKFGNFIDQCIYVIQGHGDPDYWVGLYYYNEVAGSGLIKPPEL